MRLVGDGGRFVLVMAARLVHGRFEAPVVGLGERDFLAESRSLVRPLGEAGKGNECRFWEGCPPGGSAGGDERRFLEAGGGDLE